MIYDETCKINFSDRLNRLVVYDKVLYELKNELIDDRHGGLGICEHVDRAVQCFWPRDYNACFFPKELPELVAQKPPTKDWGDFWFPGNAEGQAIRIKIIENCIEQIEKLETCY